jgi:hypothetical protein
MSACFIEPSVVNSRWKPQWPFAIFLASEDRTTDARARWLLDQLRAKPLAHYQVSFKRWPLDQLVRPDCWPQATDDALGADMIILSMHGQPTVPDGAQQWINSWCGQKVGRDCALVALLDRPQSPVQVQLPAVTFLQEVAHHTGMSFFFHVYDALHDVRASADHMDRSPAPERRLRGGTSCAARRLAGNALRSDRWA